MNILVFFGIIFACFANADQVVRAKAFAPLSCVLVSLNTVDQSVIKEICSDLAFSEQYKVASESYQGRPHKKLLHMYGAKGHTFVIFLQEDDLGFDWWVYETATFSKIAAKRYLKNGRLARGWAHQIADMVWEVLMGRPGFFSTKIVYCKESLVKRGIIYKKLCIADYNGKHEQLLVDNNSVLFAPRWGSALQKPIVFYSQEALTNTCLLSIDLDKKGAIASNRPGINMLLSFDKNCSKAIYSASDNDGYSQIFSVNGRRIDPLTSYQANSLGSVMSDQGDCFYFYTDAFGGVPQICKYSYHSNGLITMITNQGYNVGPAHNSYSKRVAYTGLRKGVMQLFLYDEDTGKHEQLTFDGAHKEDCSFSPAGDYLLIGVSSHTSKQLALFNITTKKYHYITDNSSRCMDPHWSGKYNEFPFIYD